MVRLKSTVLLTASGKNLADLGGSFLLMKRSEINRCIKEFEGLLNKHCFALPPFLSFTPEEWQTKGHEYDEVRDNALGWDITDYGEGHFETKGLYLITIRNGNVHNKKYTKTYAEKIMMLKEEIGRAHV